VTAPRKFDGCGDGQAFKAEAKRILDCAFDDEVNHRGTAQCSETLAVFIEFRIEEALRFHFEERST